MLHRFVWDCLPSFDRASAACRRARALFGILLASTSASAAEIDSGPDGAAAPSAAAHCLSTGTGYLRARLSGAWRTELEWGNEGTQCTGAVRPGDGGIRMRFSRGRTIRSSAHSYWYSVSPG